MHAFLRAALVVAAICPAALASAAGAGFDPRVVTFGPAREQLQSTPITDRPYRPLHVYGNSVRRRHERPAEQDRSLGRSPLPKPVSDYRCDELGRGRDGEGREVAARSCLRRTELP